MDIRMLCQLLMKQIPPEYFQVYGTGEVHWMSEEYNTPENRAIVDDVIANYETLAAAYIAEQEAIEATRIAAQAAKAQAFIDNLPSWAVVAGKFDTMLADAQAATNLAQAKAVLIELIKVQKKMARVLYWSVRNSEE